MKGKTVIITGGTSGMGKAMATRFCRDGANVVVTGRDPEKLEQTRKDLAEREGNVLPVRMDVRKTEQVAETVEKAREAFGGIDALVNNAAGNFVVQAEDLSENGWNAVIDIVLNGTWHCTQAVAKEWIREGRKGSIVNIVAAYAWTGAAGVVHSASAKAGVLAMSKSLAVEWGSRYGIRINCIAPGPVENTGGVDKLILSEEMHKMVLKGIPLHRFGTWDEIAGTAAFLLSPEAEYINGDCITMDGGQWMNGMRFI
ncbi:NAD(P)-dependent dehydrogenase (short-subunit alcohol dehydrogenase family) [Melghirimyces profundicolus]|uniref:NAD(P)-dependent dehydrogenase (Short-subunit alcohol dehydrogenase family) n=1 Tax=Melghirimyces profundicolus TaxID=1242148 RepID=A0A2T6C9G7_9BACL|nr:2,4-dienoyl-CoA reductase [Melghirimyces profundicolus]PTX64968.1 NAD(P)-dependent dehydrogenase (short-subunit alcohol dehydrogenase family) [Melghirimyces profundicolus]